MADNASEVAGRADMDCDGPDSGGENVSGAETTANSSVPIQKLAVSPIWVDKCQEAFVTKLTSMQSKYSVTVVEHGRYVYLSGLTPMKHE